MVTLTPNPHAFGLAVALALALVVFAGARQPSGPVRSVAITIDDVPRGGDGGGRTLAEIRHMTERLLAPLRDGGIPVIGFVNAGRPVALGPDGVRQILDVWLDYGAELGNHSYSHPNINDVPLAEYTADILKGESILREALAARGKALRYYRHPFLFTGPTPEIKRELQEFLERHRYQVAPVTLDNADYMFAALYSQPQHRERIRRQYVPYMESVVAAFEEAAVQVAGREFPQILLIHANELNADLMPDLLAMFTRRGYAFVSLERALADQAYRMADEYVGRNGFSWIHRWGLTRGVKLKPEPEPPDWVLEAWQQR